MEKYPRHVRGASGVKCVPQGARLLHPDNNNNNNYSGPPPPPLPPPDPGGREFRLRVVRPVILKSFAHLLLPPPQVSTLDELFGLGFPSERDPVGAR